MRTVVQNLKSWSRIYFLLALLIVLVYCLPSSAKAIGFGPYVDVSTGSGEWNNWCLWGPCSSDDYDITTAGFGLAVDTAPTGKTIFNYRLSIGYERQDMEDIEPMYPEYGSSYDLTLKLHGISVENVFGFAVLRRPNLRWWVGPLVRIGFYKGETEDYYGVLGDRRRTEADLTEYGVGVSSGVNIRVRKNMVLAPEAGFRFVYADGDGTDINDTIGIRSEKDIDGSFSAVFLNFALIFD